MKTYYSIWSNNENWYITSKSFLALSWEETDAYFNLLDREKLKEKDQEEEGECQGYPSLELFRVTGSKIQTAIMVANLRTEEKKKKKKRYLKH